MAKKLLETEEACVGECQAWLQQVAELRRYLDRCELAGNDQSQARAILEDLEGRLHKIVETLGDGKPL